MSMEYGSSSYYKNLGLFGIASLLLVSVVSVGVSAAGGVGEPHVPCFFIFGDSLVDNGNNNNRQTSARVNFLPYGIDFPAGPTGRFNNGRNFADILAEQLGFSKYIPPFANVTDKDILQGVNYGSGGAGILDETGRVQGDVINMNDQLSNHKVVISRIAKLIGSQKQAKQHLNKCIYAVVIGNNDYLNNYFPKYYNNTTKYTPLQFAKRLLAQYSKQLRKMYKLGARKVAVFPLGKLGCVPQHVAQYGPTNGSSCKESSNDLVVMFEDLLNQLVDRLNIQLTDTEFLYTISAVTTYGNITNASDPCCGVGSNGQCEAGSSVCKNRDEYYFWDGYHPTEAATLLSATNAYVYMSPLYNRPRPSSGLRLIKDMDMLLDALNFQA